VPLPVPSAGERTHAMLVHFVAILAGFIAALVCFLVFP
jgi:hypothetical protein